VITEPILEAADFFAPPGYRVRTSGIYSRTQLLALELEHEDGRRVEVAVSIATFVDQPNHWRWLKEVIDLEALWAIS
jgi:hypothetical protein